MSVMAAIDLAIRLQMLRDKPAHYAQLRRIMGGDATLAENAGGGHGFTDSEMDKFLQGVALSLKSDTPPLTYDWTMTDVARCLNADWTLLIGLVARHTEVP